MNETLALLNAPFVQNALKAALMVGLTCSFLGVFVVLKRIVFVGAALAEISTLGAALAFFPIVVALFEKLLLAIPALRPIEHYEPLVLALVMMLVAVAFFSLPGLGRRIPREAIIGGAYAGAVGLTLLVLSQVPQSEHTKELLEGNILFVQPLEMLELLITCVGVSLVQLLFYKEFVLVSFDPEVARTLGFNSSRWELLWYLSLGVMIAVSIHVAGAMLVFAYLVLPPVTALLLSRRLGVVLFLSVLFGFLGTVLGVVGSLPPMNTPTSYTIVGVMVLLFVICWLGKSAWEAVASRMAVAEGAAGSPAPAASGARTS